jgi:hypothetical protein
MKKLGTDICMVAGTLALIALAFPNTTMDQGHGRQL